MKLIFSICQCSEQRGGGRCPVGSNTGALYEKDGSLAVPTQQLEYLEQQITSYVQALLHLSAQLALHVGT